MKDENVFEPFKTVYFQRTFGINSAGTGNLDDTDHLCALYVCSGERIRYVCLVRLEAVRKDCYESYFT